MAKIFGTGIDLAHNQLLRPRIENLSADPSSPVLGQIYYNTVSNALMVYTGSSFGTLSTAAIADATTGAKGIVQLAGDFAGTATSPTVVSTHLSSALPVNQGGTGALTLTGVLIGNGTGAFTAVTPPSGAIVGTTDTQTLSAKTLTNPTINAASLSGTFAGAHTISGVATFTAIPAFNVGISSATGAITVSTPALTATQTWNAAGATFDGIFLNITNTASAAASRLIDLQVAGASQFSVDVNSNVRATTFIGNLTGNVTGNTSGSAGSLSSTLIVGQGGTGATTLTGILVGNGTSPFTTVTAPTGAIVGTTDTQTLSAKTLTNPTINAAALSGTFSGAATFSGALILTSSLTSTTGSIVANTPVHTATQTWNAAGVSFQGYFLNVTNTASAAGSRLIDLQVASTSQFSVSAAGNGLFAGTITAGSGANVITTAAGLLDATKLTGAASSLTSINTSAGAVIGGTITAGSGANVLTNAAGLIDATKVNSATVLASGTIPTTIPSNLTTSATFMLNFSANSGPQIKASTATEISVVDSGGSTLANLRVNNLYVNGEMNEVAGTVITTGDAFVRLNDAITVHGSNSAAGITVKRLKTDDATLASVSNQWSETAGRWVQDIVSADGQTVYTALTQGAYIVKTITGDGTTTSFAQTHNLNNQYPAVQIIETAGNTEIETTVTYTSTTVTTISWDIAPANGLVYKVVFVG